MKTQEMATALQTLCDDFGVNSSVLADDLTDYMNKITDSYIATGGLGNSATISLIPDDNRLMTIDGTCYVSLANDYYRPRRLKCVYCDCISSKESGTCEHCGAPLVEDEY